MWAFSDESERGGRMLFGVLMLRIGAVAGARNELRRLLLPGQRRVHTSDESARRRRVLLDLVAGLPGHAIVFELRRPMGVNRVEARDRLLTEAARTVVRAGVTTWTLDDQHPVQAVRDRRQIDGAFANVEHSPAYDHRPAPAEPLLWAIDAIVWAIGAGSPWSQRIDHLVAKIEIEP